MEQLIGITLLIIFSGIAIAAFFSVIIALFSARVEKVRRAFVEVPTRTFWIGLVNTLFFSALTLGLLALGENVLQLFYIPATLIVVFLVIALIFGLAGVVEYLGNRWFAASTELRRNIFGTILLYLACLTPFVGWFLLLVFVGIMGIGAFLLSLIRKPMTPEEK